MSSQKYYPKRLICAYDYAREPVIRRMPDGSLVCVALSGGTHDTQTSNITLISRSYDDGESWSKPETLFSHSERGCWSTEIFTGGDVPMIIVQTYVGVETYREIQTFRSYTFDSGKSWTSPVSLPSGVDNVSVRQGIVLSNGDWLFPLYWQETINDGFDWNRADHSKGPTSTFRSGVAISCDRGESYSRYGCFYSDDVRCWEPNAVELEPGHIFCLMRHGTEPLYTESFDYGRSWSPVKRYTAIENADAKFSLLRVRNHIVLLNNFTTVSRSCLQLWSSGDFCKTWTTKLPLADPDEIVFYPHGYADDAKQLLYVAFEDSARRHWCMKIPYSDILG